MRCYIAGSAALLAAMLLASQAVAQRGTGEPGGVARQKAKPKIVKIEGVITAIKTGPCEKTTGKSPIGSHLLLKGKKASYNLHLGPESAVKDIVGKANVGDRVNATAFRTGRLPKDHMIAVKVEVGGKEFVLRDDTLRPRWARRPRGRGR